MSTKQQGFTLIELMIVVAIIGILAAISVPMYRDYVTKTRFGAALASVASLQSQIALAENEGLDLSTFTAANGNDGDFQTLGLRGAPAATNEVDSIAVLANGVIQMGLTAKVPGCDAGVLTITPTFRATNTIWQAAFTTDCGDANSKMIIEQYITKNMSS